ASGRNRGGSRASFRIFLAANNRNQRWSHSSSPASSSRYFSGSTALSLPRSLPAAALGHALRADGLAAALPHAIRGTAQYPPRVLRPNEEAVALADRLGDRAGRGGLEQVQQDFGIAGPCPDQLPLSQLDLVRVGRG